MLEDHSSRWTAAASPGGLIGLVFTILSLIAVVTSILSITGRFEIALDEIVIYAILGLSVFTTILLLYLLVAYLSISYRLDPGKLTIKWGFWSAQIPFEEIDDVAPATHVLDEHSGGWQLFWPGYYIGKRNSELGPIRVIATLPPRRQILIARTDETIYAISPERPLLFMEELARWHAAYQQREPEKFEAPPAQASYPVEPVDAHVREFEESFDPAIPTEPRSAGAFGAPPQHVAYPEPISVSPDPDPEPEPLREPDPPPPDERPRFSPPAPQVAPAFGAPPQRVSQTEPINRPPEAEPQREPIMEPDPPSSAVSDHVPSPAPASPGREPVFGVRPEQTARAGIQGPEPEPEPPPDPLETQETDPQMIWSPPLPPEPEREDVVQQFVDAGWTTEYSTVDGVSAEDASRNAEPAPQASPPRIARPERQVLQPLTRVYRNAPQATSPALRPMILRDPVALSFIGVGVLATASMAIYILVQYQDIPPSLTLHWNVDGLPGRVGEPREIWVLPVIAGLVLIANIGLAWSIAMFDRFAARLMLGSTLIAHLVTWVALLMLLQ